MQDQRILIPLPPLFAYIIGLKSASLTNEIDAENHHVAHRTVKEDGFTSVMWSSLRLFRSASKFHLWVFRLLPMKVTKSVFFMNIISWIHRENSYIPALRDCPSNIFCTFNFLQNTRCTLLFKVALSLRLSMV